MSSSFGSKDFPLERDICKNCVKRVVEGVQISKSKALLLCGRQEKISGIYSAGSLYAVLLRPADVHVHYSFWQRI